jgi:hypothetical protein
MGNNTSCSQYNKFVPGKFSGRKIGQSSYYTWNGRGFDERYTFVIRNNENGETRAEFIIDGTIVSTIDRNGISNINNSTNISEITKIINKQVNDIVNTKVNEIINDIINGCINEVVNGVLNTRIDEMINSRLIARIDEMINSRVSNLVNVCNESNDKCIHESNDKCIHESSDKCVHESSDKCVHESSDKCVHESDDKCIHESNDKCIHESNDKCIHESNDKCIHESNNLCTKEDIRYLHIQKITFEVVDIDCRLIDLGECDSVDSLHKLDMLCDGRLTHGLLKISNGKCTIIPVIDESVFEIGNYIILNNIIPVVKK